ncbi:MAG TPA: exopolysaccharide biosynthesis protein [Hyphomonadaceae bacterium]|nr:exopolysaccharide biosynthesis protein [Hyphomonadaceae bacterium]
MRIMERRSFGAVILLLGVIAISPLTVVPGATWTVAAVTLLFSVQLLFAMRHPWLPKRLLDLKMPRDQLIRFAKASRRVAHTADKLTAPRLRFLTRPPFVFGVALLCIAAALITFPLGLIPLAPVLPGLAIVLMGIGLTARDGVFLVLSTLAMAGSVMILARLLL